MDDYGDYLDYGVDSDYVAPPMPQDLSLDSSKDFVFDEQSFLNSISESNAIVLNENLADLQAQRDMMNVIDASNAAVLRDNLNALQAQQVADLTSSLKNDWQAIAGGAPVSPQQSGDFLQRATQLLLTAGTAVAAWNNAGRPSIKMSGSSYGAGQTATASPDGMLTVVNSQTGRASKGRPPIGQPFVTTTGEMVTNNGDGSYTLVALDGSIRKLTYPMIAPNATSGSAVLGPTLAGGLKNIDPKLLIAGLGLAIVLLRKK